MTGPLLDLLGAPPILFDGAMGSLLMAAGLPPGEAPERWNLENPAALLASHRAYFEAGSRVVHSNSFGGSRLKLQSAGLADRFEPINAAAVQIAKEAAQPSGGWVAGDIGPSGQLVEPFGEMSEAELEEAFAEQADALGRAGADLISIETMYDLTEALCALRGAKRAVSVPVIVSLTFEQRGDEFVTIMGNKAIESWQRLADAGADGVGSNCTLGSTEMIALAEAAAGKLPVPLLLQPNAGQPQIEGAVATYEQTPESFADDIAKIAAAGVPLIGGCCGSTPAFIQALTRRLAP